MDEQREEKNFILNNRNSELTRLTFEEEKLLEELKEKELSNEERE